MPQLGVLGTGQVGRAIAERAVEVGYEVTVGARAADSVSLEAFAGQGIGTGSYADAARSAPLLVNATPGAFSESALASIGVDGLRGKVVLDLGNELVPVAEGFPLPAATAERSLGARLQQRFPEASVVKALNTMNHEVMVRPGRIPGDHLVFLCGDDAGAKETVRDLLRAFGWREPQMMDLGGIDAAAATEMMMAVWMRVTLARGAGAPRFNWAILEADAP
jgi:predicted dinucleotide-binding enzyme